jgi:glycosyltransferase involved in cell wall biosynthesis
LHVLSQRPSRTGSGITLESIVRHAQAQGWSQAAVVGVPATDPLPEVGTLAANDVLPVTFQDRDRSDIPSDIPFSLPGMSDVMPYPSSIWSQLGADELEIYRQKWRSHLRQVIANFQPDLIHGNHIWLVTSLLPELAQGIPVVATCHATGLRQMELTPHLKEEVVSSCCHLDHVFALRTDHKKLLQKILNLPEDRLSVIGVGFRDEVFHSQAEEDMRDQQAFLFVGKYSQAKGLPWLLDAFARLQENHPEVRLHIAGDGAGLEAEALRKRMQEMGRSVVLHGMLNQEKLADLMNRCGTCVLPSFYEGVPLVLAEAAACGCRIVATDLPGVREQLAPHLGPWLRSITLPPLVTIDQPDPEYLPGFVEDLNGAMEASLVLQPISPPQLTPLTWRAVFHRVEEIWKNLTC